MTQADLLQLAPEVRQALATGQAVVALESTLIAHGMPYPQNLQTGRALEQAVRAQGAVPATIALVDGSLAVGLSGDQLEQLAARGQGAAKASCRDLAALVVQRATGGTTVAATMRIAALAGIGVFATGGIGGVHRGAETSFDISADLTELARTPVAVVCAGAKSILDIGKTLEVLETLGVPVLGYRTDEFPAFYSRHSGHSVSHRFDTVHDIARVIAWHRRVGHAGGVLVANPVPEHAALEAAGIEARIAEALAQAEAAGIAGKALTPYLLQRINELSGGDSLQANIALATNNAALAGEIAVALAGLGA
ncbi:MAG TPA: pseudouridine-5'-phosphate glycosidase [Burkholderiaceae bacterium]|nr:pseudouridine-5'-phosphate glycosidase [Burkholderiaceae bacterium]